LDILQENKKPYRTSAQSEHYWTQGKIKDINGEILFVNLAEEENTILFRKTSLNHAKKGTYTKNYDWKINLKAGDVIECLDREKFYPATVIERYEESRNGMISASYNIGFRLYPQTFPQWENHRHFWDKAELTADCNNKIFFGDKENFDEKIPFFSSRIDRLGTHEKKSKNSNNDNSDESEAYCIDDLVVYDLKALTDQNENENDNQEKAKDQINKNENLNEEAEESDIAKFKNFIAKTKAKLNSYGKSYVIAKSMSYSLYYALLISEFASNKSYEKMLNLLHKTNAEKPNPELIYFIFLFFGFSSTILHKEFLIQLSFDMKENVISYLKDLSEKDLRNMKKETIEIIQKVLQYYLSFSMSVSERSSIIESFSISFSLKMLKSSLLDKRISAVKSIVDVINNAKNDKEKTAKLLEIIEQHKIFNEIFGPNSHIQLINRSKSLLEIMLSEDKLSNEELELIWEATKKGDLEAKLTIMKLLEEISLNLKDKHVDILLKHVYLTEPENLIKEEIDLVHELATHYTQPQDEIRKVIDFFLKGLFSGKIDENEEKIQMLIEKIFLILKNQRLFGIEKNLFTEFVVNILVDNIRNNNIKNSFISLRILKLLFRDFPEIYSENADDLNNGKTRKESIDVKDNNDIQANADSIANEKKPNLNMKEFIGFFVSNFEEYRMLVKNAIKNKNYDIESFPNIDNFTYSKNIRKRLGIISSLIFKKIWDYETDPINLVYKFLIEDATCEKDNMIFYEWIKYLLKSEKLDNENEMIIFNLFNNNICSGNKKCQNLVFQGFESYLKIFLDINKKNNLLDFYVLKVKLQF
jgi:hypothetical protein